MNKQEVYNITWITLPQTPFIMGVCSYSHNIAFFRHKTDILFIFVTTNVVLNVSNKCSAGKFCFYHKCPYNKTTAEKKAKQISDFSEKDIKWFEYHFSGLMGEIKNKFQGQELDGGILILEE